MRLSPHFHLDEYTASETAARNGIDNTPPPELIGNLKRMAETMERIRDLLGTAIIVTSGYRCLELNRLLKSKDTSAHVKGLATDFISPSFGTPLEVCRRLEPLVSELGLDQLIYEKTWVHVGLSSGTPRHELWTLQGVGFVRGIVG